MKKRLEIIEIFRAIIGFPCFPLIHSDLFVAIIKFLGIPLHIKLQIVVADVLKIADMVICHFLLLLLLLLLL